MPNPTITILNHDPISLGPPPPPDEKTTWFLRTFPNLDSDGSQLILSASPPSSQSSDSDDILAAIQYHPSGDLWFTSSSSSHPATVSYAAQKLQVPLSSKAEVYLIPLLHDSEISLSGITGGVIRISETEPPQVPNTQPAPTFIPPSIQVMHSIPQSGDAMPATPVEASGVEEKKVFETPAVRSRFVDPNTARRSVGELEEEQEETGYEEEEEEEEVEASFVPTAPMRDGPDGEVLERTPPMGRIGESMIGTAVNIPEEEEEDGGEERPADSLPEVFHYVKRKNERKGYKKRGARTSPIREVQASDVEDEPITAKGRKRKVIASVTESPEPEVKKRKPTEKAQDDEDSQDSPFSTAPEERTETIMGRPINPSECSTQDDLSSLPSQEPTPKTPSTRNRSSKKPTTKTPTTKSSPASAKSSRKKHLSLESDSTPKTTQHYSGPPPRISFSNSTLSDSKPILSFLRSHNAKVVDVTTDTSCDHLIIGGELKRTPKFTIAVARGIKIVEESWLLESKAAGYWLDPDSYVPSAPGDWEVDLEEAVERGRKGDAKVLEGVSVYLTPSLVSHLKQLKSEEALVSMLKAAGAEGVHKKAPRGEVEEGTLVLGRDEGDKEAKGLEENGWKVYQTAVVGWSVLRGRLETGKDMKVKVEEVKETPGKRRRSGRV